MVGTSFDNILGETADLIKSLWLQTVELSHMKLKFKLLPIVFINVKENAMTWDCGEH